MNEINRFRTFDANRLSVAALVCAILPGCGQLPGRAVVSDVRMRPSALDLRIEGGKIAERCAALVGGQRVEWRFTSTISVDFNIHTHVGGSVITPVDRRQVESDSGSQRIDSAGEYCLMWQNRSGVPAFVRGDWQIAQR